MTWRNTPIDECPHVVYRIYDVKDTLLYVGVSADFDARFRNHKSRAAWVPDYHRHELTWYPDRWQAESAEMAAIMSENPQYNVAGNRQPRPEKPVRMTLDLTSAQHLALRTFVGSAGAGGSAANVLRALLDELQANPDLADRVRSRIRTVKR